jgi:hypothetical protein
MAIISIRKITPPKVVLFLCWAKIDNLSDGGLVMKSMAFILNI